MKKIHRRRFLAITSLSSVVGGNNRTKFISCRDGQRINKHRTDKSAGSLDETKIWNVPAFWSQYHQQGGLG
jgi:hypothetical protein